VEFLVPDDYIISQDSTPDLGPVRPILIPVTKDEEPTLIVYPDIRIFMERSPTTRRSDPDRSAENITPWSRGIMIEIGYVGEGIWRRV
jgi:hypothetical protein